MKKITVIGIGRLGLGLALLIKKSGYQVCGVDINQNYVNSLNNKTYTSKEPEYENLLTTSKNFKATISLEEGLNFSNIIFCLIIFCSLLHELHAFDPTSLTYVPSTPCHLLSSTHY